MTFHPLTHITIALEFSLLVLFLPLVPSFMIILFWLMVVLMLPSRTSSAVTRLFLKSGAAAAFFLFLIQGMRWHPPGIDPAGVLKGLDIFLNIAAPCVFVIHLSRMIRSEELFALLLDMKVPPTVIFTFFRTLWLVPRFMERIDEVMLALKLRGMPLERFTDRMRALAPSLNPIVSSMIEEMSVNALSVTAGGFLQPGAKSHYTLLSFRWSDCVFLFAVNLIIWVIWF